MRHLNIPYSDNARALARSERNAQIDDELIAALERWEDLGKTGA
jgi:ABC transport system ATP-binding/permease protein